MQALLKSCMRKASILIVFFAAVFRNVYQITLTSLPRPHPSAPPEIKEFGANGVLHIEPKQLLVNLEKACGLEGRLNFFGVKHFGVEKETRFR